MKGGSRFTGQGMGSRRKQAGRVPSDGWGGGEEPFSFKQASISNACLPGLVSAFFCPARQVGEGAPGELNWWLAVGGSVSASEHGSHPLEGRLRRKRDP